MIDEAAGRAIWSGAVQQGVQCVKLQAKLAVTLYKLVGAVHGKAKHAVSSCVHVAAYRQHDTRPGVTP